VGLGLSPSRDLVTLSGAKSPSPWVQDGFFTAFRMTIASPAGSGADFDTALQWARACLGPGRRVDEPQLGLWERALPAQYSPHDQAEVGTYARHGPGAGRLAAEAAATQTKPACAGWRASLLWAKGPWVNAQAHLPGSGTEGGLAATRTVGEGSALEILAS